MVGQGNAGLNTRWNFNSLADGRYSIRVQAIDGGYLGSDFSEERIVYVGTPAAPEIKALLICFPIILRTLIA